MRKHSFSFLFLVLSIVASAQTKLQVVDDSVRISNGQLVIRNGSVGIGTSLLFTPLPGNSILFKFMSTTKSVNYL